MTPRNVCCYCDQLVHTSREPHMTETRYDRGRPQTRIWHIACDPCKVTVNVEMLDSKKI
jgi:hypothetical protein